MMRLLLAPALSVLLHAQSYTISTLAGGVPPPTPAGALETPIGNVTGMAFGPDGGLYFSSGLQCVFRVDAAGGITLVAGNARAGYSGDEGPATSAQLHAPGALAFDSAGNLYIADTANDAIRVVSPDGTIGTRARVTGLRGLAVSPVGEIYFSVADGVLKLGGHFAKLPILVAAMNLPAGLAFDDGGSLYVAEPGAGRVQRIDPSGAITTVAAKVFVSGGIAVDAARNVYFPSGVSIGRISAQGSTSVPATFPGRGFSISAIAIDAQGRPHAGTTDGKIGILTPAATLDFIAGAMPAHAGDGGPANAAQLLSPQSVATDRVGDVYIADTGSRRIRKVSPGGVITTVVDFSTDAIPGVFANSLPTSVAVSGEGNLYFTASASSSLYERRSNGRIQGTELQVLQVFADPNGVLYLLHPFLTSYGLWRLDGGSVTTLVNGFFSNSQMAADANGNIFYEYIGYIFTYSASGGFRRYAPAPGGQVRGVAVDSLGNLYITHDCQVDRLTPTGDRQPVAGTGVCAYTGDGGPALEAQINPSALAIDSQDNIYLVEQANNAVRVLKPHI